MWSAWTFGRSILTAFATLAALALAIAVVSILSVREVVSDNDSLVRGSLQDLMIAGDLARAHHARTSEIRAYLLSPSSRQRRVMSDSRAEFLSVLGTLNQRAEGPADAREVLASVAPLEAEYTQRLEQAIRDPARGQAPRGQAKKGGLSTSLAALYDRRMLTTTLSRLRCPICEDSLDLRARRTLASSGAADVQEVVDGDLECRGCKGVYPILAGVAILVADVGFYLQEHVKGISRLVPDSAIPPHFLEDFREARANIELEHIESDLESERVISLYLMNHYLHASRPGEPAWWHPLAGNRSPLIDSLIREHWDSGPLARLAQWVSGEKSAEELGRGGSVVELGCGVGGLAVRLKGGVRSYLGVDSSFASVALGRHLALGVPYPAPIRIPEDLYHGPVSRVIELAPAGGFDGSADLVVGEIDGLPLARGEFDFSLAVNVSDMLEHPELLPEIQRDLLRPGGIALDSCPYIWREDVAEMLRENLPAEIRDSASVARWLYANAGLEVEREADHVPWLFFKHARQLEIYSVHLLLARKPRE